MRTTDRPRDDAAALLEKRNLYRDACRVVVHLAGVIALTYEQTGGVADGSPERIIDAMLPSAWSFMNVLGDAISGHEMVDPDGGDEWVNPIFERMRDWHDEWQKRWQRKPHSTPDA